MSDTNTNTPNSVETPRVLSERPCFLVLCSTEVRGGVHRKSEDATPPVSPEAVGLVIPGAAVETVKVTAKKTYAAVDDPAEFEAASKLRAKLYKTIADLCIPTPFCLLCPLDSEAKFEEAKREAEREAYEFNKTAKFSTVQIWVLRGALTGDSQEKAAKWLATELASLIQQMKTGLENRDTKSIESAIRKARSLNDMIDTDAQLRVARAIDIAKKAAKEITKTIEAKGTKDVLLVADGNKRVFEELAKTFSVVDLDIPTGDSTAPAPVEALPAVGATEIDLPPLGESDPPAAAAPAPVADLDMSDDDGDAPLPAAPAVALGDVDAQGAIDLDWAAESAAGAPDAAPMMA